MYMVRSIIRIFLMCFVALSVVSCESEQSSLLDKGDVMISLRADASSFSSKVSSWKDPSVKKLRIMVFDSNGYIDTNKLFGPSDSNPFKVSTRFGSNKTIVVVGNETDQMSLNTILNLTQLKEVMLGKYEDRSTTLSDNNLPKVIIGEAKVDVTEEVKNVEIKLKRAYAKLTLKIAKSDTNSTDVIILQSVKLCNMSSNAPLFEKEEGKSTKLYDVTKDLKKKEVVVPEANSSDDPTVVRDYYIYEQVGNTTTESRQPMLIVKALYNGVETVYKKVISFDQGKTGSQIKRNHNCTISATIKKMGEFDSMTLETEIVPWTEETIDKEFAMAYLEECKYFDPDDGSWHDFDPEHHYQVNPNLPAKFKLTIHSDIPDLQWRANLSNGLNFSVTPSTGKVNEMVEIEVKSSIPNVRIPVEFGLSFAINKKYVVASQGSTEKATIKLIQSPR